HASCGGSQNVMHVAALLPAVTVAVVGIGAWAEGLSTVFDAVEPDTRARVGPGDRRSAHRSLCTAWSIRRSKQLTVPIAAF
ncbi:MAG: hypothetical protein JWO57_3995, partial [Pseudonocardiales bacterium]|nr:hypothetical protein [Pseudonocardiales bacterium]